MTNDTQSPELTDGFHLVIDALKLNGITTSTVCRASGTDLTRMMQEEGMRVISFRHEQNAGNAAAIAGFMTGSRCLPDGVRSRLPQRSDRAGQCHHQLLPDDPDQRLQRARDRRLQQGDYEEMDQLAIASPCARLPSACSTPRTSAWASPAPSVPLSPAARAVSTWTCPPSCSARPWTLRRQGVADQGGRSRTAPDPRPDAVKRALDLLKSAKKPLILLARAPPMPSRCRHQDPGREVRIPYLPCPWPKASCPIP